MRQYQAANDSQTLPTAGFNPQSTKATQEGNLRSAVAAGGGCSPRSEDGHR